MISGHYESGGTGFFLSVYTRFYVQGHHAQRINNAYAQGLARTHVLQIECV